MGGTRRCNKFAQRKRDRKEMEKNPRPKEDGDGRKYYPEIIRENETFETYYKTQKICTDDEWDTFMKTIKENLPTAFRITGSKGEANALLNIVKGRLFTDILNSKTPQEENKNGDENAMEEVVDEEAKKPICLPWYPGGLAWQLQLTRTDIRRSEAYYRLHNFLTAETNSGSISRQEAVSMIPPIALDVKPHHKVLDMCASPGSKTAQLIEFLHASEDGSSPTGFVMANDVDNGRCYMLVHQAKRLNSPCILITNHDAAFLPNLTVGDGWAPDGTNPDNIRPEKMGSRFLKFDRVLCDVPCSGDGTLRKNADIWLKWSVGNGNNLHGVQYRIAIRGAEMLNIGGRLAYSTCSLNPIENESVIFRVLKEAKGSLKLVDVSHMLPGLKYSKGMTHWRPASKDMVFYDKYEDVPERWTTVVRPQMFPPTPEEIKEYDLEKCIRILPHHQDTGAFFVAVLEKVAKLPNEKEEPEKPVEVKVEEVKVKVEEVKVKVEEVKVKVEEVNVKVEEDDKVKTEYGDKSKAWALQRKRKKLGGYKEDPYVFFSGENEDVFPSIKDFYNLTDFDPTCLLTRCLTGKKKNVYLVSPIVRDLVLRNEDCIKIINTGVKTFVRCDNKNMACAFRLSQEGLSNIIPCIGSGRKLKLPKKDLILLLLNDNPSMPPDIGRLTSETQELVKDLSCGSCVLLYDDGDLKLELVGWRGVKSLRAYTALPDTIHMLRLLGEDTSKYEVNKFKKNEENEKKDDEENTVEPIEMDTV